MSAIESCRTAALGGHVALCQDCGHRHIAYHSCRNRHCPKCQALAQADWLEARRADLLPVDYFHVVFTLPHALCPLALYRPRVVYDLLFRAASDTLATFARDARYFSADSGGTLGITAILHTWGQNLLAHPHLHCVIPGGGISSDGERWVHCRDGFFLPVRVLSRMFRGKFLALLLSAFEQQELQFHGQLRELAHPKAWEGWLEPIRNKEWVVYAKPPLGRSQHVLKYLARYTHRVALTNDRILRVEEDQVTFRYRDSQDHNRIKEMTLDAVEFIRRFLLHVLPDRFVKIRHYGLLSNRKRKVCIRRCKELLGIASSVAEGPTSRATWQEIMERLTGTDPMCCPHCGKGKMVTRQFLLPLEDRAPLFPVKQAL